MAYRTGVQLARVSAARAGLAAKHAADPGAVPRFDARMARLSAIRKRNREEAGGWCILRTNGRRTLALEEALNEAGIEAWTPQRVGKRRLPRGRKGFKETVEAMVPSFVFVRASRLPDLLHALALPVCPYPYFSIFQHAGRAPVVSDREIAHLQRAEEASQRTALRSARHNVAVGTAVRPTEGAFAGLQGVVEQVHGKVAEVCFNEHFRVKVATWLLVAGDIEPAPAQMGAAAQAA